MSPNIQMSPNGTFPADPAGTTSTSQDRLNKGVHVTLQLDQELHSAGERTPVRDFGLVQALGWWVAAELMRRHPGQLYVFNTGGEFQYDVLAVSKRIRAERTERSQAVVWMNRNHNGHFTTGTWFDDSSSTDRFNWLEVLLSTDRLGYVVNQLEREAGLTSPKKTPATTKESVGARIIAGFLARTIFVKASWHTINGVWDSGMGEAGVNRELFKKVPGMEAQTPKPDSTGFLEPDAFRFWFLQPATTHNAGSGYSSSSDQPVIGFDLLNGICWNGSSTDPITLMDRYNKVGRSMDALISAVCPPAY